MDDDDGQYDGEVRYRANPMQSQPWMRGASPPWHMWGNTQRLTFTVGGFGDSRGLQQQLARVAYKRPETWHWLFHARIVSGPTVQGVQEAGVRVYFDVTIGIGRSVATMSNFETFQWRWSDPGGGVQPTPPVDVVMWSTASLAPERGFSNNAGIPIPAAARLPQVIDELVGQDIQVTTRLESLSNFPNTIVLEVSTFWAPKTHIRPDWLQLDVPPEAQFPGEEIGGT